MKKIIYIDMDNTINDFWIPYVSYYNKISGKSVPLDPQIMVKYSLSECLGIEKGSKLEKELDTATMCSYKFWTDDMPVKQGAAEVIKRMYDKYDLYILSTPYVEYNNCIPAKMEWMEKHFPFFEKKKMIFTWHKELLRGDILIDDKPENLKAFNGNTITIDYPYNKKTSCLKGKDWYEIERIVNAMHGEDEVEKQYSHLL